MAKARQQYFADETTLQKESREFAITPDIINKLDSIETWAQVNVIETVKVNWTALVPDANKAVNVEVPDVIDNLFSTSTDDALSAKQWKVLYDYLQNIASRWRYLSNWNCVTGLAMTNPSENPYPYKAWDYYSVSNVAPIWGTNYRPNGTQYIIWQASTTVETELVSVSDFYLYDGTNWLLLANSARQIAVDSSLSTTSTNPVENRVVTNAINWKQDTLVAWTNIQIAQDWKTISATDTTYSAWTNISIDANNEISAVDTTYTAWANIQISNQDVISATDTVYTAWTNVQIDNNVISATDTTYVAWDFDIKDLADSAGLRAEWSWKQDELIAWNNIQIAADWKTISAIDTTYTAGTWISIDSNNVISNTQTSAEWWNITGTLSDQTDLQSALDAKQDDMVILSYGNSTWSDFITAYQKNWVVYCRASSNSNPATGTQWRLAFMAYVNNANSPTEVEFQYYRSRSDHNSAANQLDEVYVYKLTSNWTWTVTQRNTAAKVTAWTWISLTYGSGNMTISNTWVTSVNGQTWDVTISWAVWWNITWNIADQTDLQEAISSATSGAVSDTAYWDSWDWITGIAPSKNAVYDKISAMDVTISWKANSSDVNTKTFTLSSTSDTTNATSAVNWYENWNTPIIKMTLRTEPTYFYLSYDMVTSEMWWDRHILYFKSPVRNWKYEQIVITTDTSWSVTNIAESEENALSTQIAYTTKGTSTKVPTITTNTLWQVTAITETNIAFPVTSVNWQTWAVTVDISWKQDKATSWSSAPSSTPTYVWQQYVDTTNDTLYVATGTSSSSDWIEVWAWSWDMNYSDFNWASKTWATITLDLASTISPSSDFTVNAPSTIKDGQTYILRVNNEGTAYEMTLWTNVTNPYDTDITLTDDWVDQFVFLAINWELELQPEWWGGWGWDYQLAPNSPLKPKYRWYGTQAQYDALTQYYTDEEWDTVYFTI